jgi:XTP/dITP diphosphohydrolase
MTKPALEVLLATRNRGKIREFRQICADLPGLRLLSPDDVPGLPEVVEDGTTFEANASKKAREIARASGHYALADDSGLEVDVLGGRPGVYSARYAGDHASDEDNNQRLIAELRALALPIERRTARYRVVLALVAPERPFFIGPHLERGSCEGRIRLEPSGEGGFGYDPYFEVEGYGRTMAELAADEKNRISHRGQAMRGMRAFLQRLLERRAL